MSTEAGVEKQAIGWREWVELPDLHLGKIKAKIDTGARSSSIHAFDIEPFEKDGEQWVRFAIHPQQHSDDEVVQCEAPIKDYRSITDSGGHKTMRYIIETPFKIGNDTFLAELSLFNRSNMLFRMLVGRTALKGRYLVDPARSYCLSTAPTQDVPHGTKESNK
ncbi:ATP-dependent zinc protease [Litorivivens sp.]|uniref:ATP-dependent zinc protease family protein n=1 Tax=Litorivivens sp. TaxID=2020868 RepID=UPI0035661372